MSLLYLGRIREAVRLVLESPIVGIPPTNFGELLFRSGDPAPTLGDHCLGF